MELETWNLLSYQVGEHDGGEFAHDALLRDDIMEYQSGEICEEILGITRICARRLPLKNQAGIRR